MATRDLPTGVYRKPEGFQVKVKRDGRAMTQRYPVGTPLARMVAKRDEFRALLAAMADAKAGSALPYAVRTLREVATLLEAMGDAPVPPPASETSRRVRDSLERFFAAMHATDGPAAPAGKEARRG